MSLIRLYSQTITSPQTILSGSEAHHLASVMRRAVGSEVELFDGLGTIAKAVVKFAKKREVILNVTQISKAKLRSENRIILVVSLAKGQRFDWLISKCTELGIDHIIPAIYSNTVKQGSGEKLVLRYNNLAISAAKQCKRAVLPQIDAPQTLAQALGKVREEYPSSTLLTASLSENPASLFDDSKIPPKSDKIVFIGPEGGLTADEEAILSENGAVRISLTETILRVETAALAVTSILAVRRDNEGKYA